MLIKTKKNNIPESIKRTENVVMRELSKLEVSYSILNDVCLSLYRPVTYRNTEENIKSCQIDFVVIGPTGIFNIGAKEWSEKILGEANQIPLKDVDMAGLVFYIRTVNRFHRKLPIYNVAVMLQKVPKVQYEYVHHLSLKQLYWFILRREGVLSKKSIKKIVRWLTKISHRKPVIRKITK